MIINYFGGFGTTYGYGSATEQLAVGLENAGVDVRLMRITGERAIAALDDVTPAGKKILSKPFQKSDIAICVGHPPFFREIQQYKYRIGYTMFESNKLPDPGPKGDWVKMCNTLTRLWVPSQSSKELFEKSGVTVPIDVVRNGVNPSLFPLVERPKRDVFTFLMYGVLTIRKNPGQAISAFLSMFKDNPNAHLILKTQSGTLGHLQLEDKNITIIDRKYNHEELQKLLASADAFVFPSRGEGFGLPPLEAMSTGLPTIVSANSGMLEFANGEYNFPLPCLKMKKTTHVPKDWGDIGYWWEPDYGMLKATMKFLYDNQDYAREIGKKGSKWVQEHFTWDQAGLKGKSILEDMIKE
jgi:glycosyltransferase involved in cell wall biosynthesis